MKNPLFSFRLPPLLKNLIKQRLQEKKEKTGKKVSMAKLIIELLWEEIKKPLF